MSRPENDILSPIKNNLAVRGVTKAPGTYALLYRLETPTDIVVGALGTVSCQSGCYVYVGSALGSGGLLSRLAHHLTITDKPHWHVDHLRPAMTPEELWFTHDSLRRECSWACCVGRLEGATMPKKGLGSSDCKCQSHLFYLRTRPLLSDFLRHCMPEHGAAQGVTLCDHHSEASAWRNVPWGRVKGNAT